MGQYECPKCGTESDKQDFVCYQGYEIIKYCPHCETVMSESYLEMLDELNRIRSGLRDHKGSNKEAIKWTLEELDKMLQCDAKSNVGD